MIVYKSKVSKDFWKFVLEQAVTNFPTELKQKEKQNKVEYVELNAVCVGYDENWKKNRG